MYKEKLNSYKSRKSNMSKDVQLQIIVMEDSTTGRKEPQITKWLNKPLEASIEFISRDAT